ncbi:MAG: hypothetical protein AABX30_00785 [Nanoarchaeota archaeon]
MTNELIHVKFEYDEALRSKRDILLSEREIIKAIRIIRRYNFFRKSELKIKLRLDRTILETVNEIKKLQNTLPRVKIPEVIREEIGEDIESLSEKIERAEEERYDEDLEEQLRKIQEKLNSLS